MAVDISLKDKVVLITGARQGLGKAMALRFAEAGADIIVNDVVVEDGRLNDTADEIRKIKRRVLAIQADISRNNEIKAMFEKVDAEFGRIDVLVNNAAITDGAHIVSLAESDWDRAMGIGLKGAFMCSQEAGKRMMLQMSGNIINIASIRAFRPKAGYCPYGVIKAALVLLTQQLARELGDFNIRANAIAPGYIKTEMTKVYWEIPDLLEQMLGEIPLGHQVGEPIDVANAAIFLTSDLAKYITGHTLVVDGGVLSGHPVVPYRLSPETLANKPL